MTNNPETLARLKDLLSYRGHSKQYQVVPDFIQKKIDGNEVNYESIQLAWDEPRYNWIKSVLPESIVSEVELGASLGYFSLRLAHDFGCTATGFEPVEVYAEAANLFAEIGELGDQVRFIGHGVTLDTIEDMPDADLLVTLNVLHHAGNVFDAQKVAEVGNWRSYAVEYLSRMAAKYPHMIFQTGNSVKGVAHFPGREAVPFMRDVLKEAGYGVEALGLITDLDSISYKTFGPDQIDDAPVIWCQRNLDTGEVDYYRNDKVVKSLPYGTLQRPLFYCCRR